MSMYKLWWKSIYKKIMMKSNYKNTQNKWQEDFANWFIELIKNIFFSRNLKGTENNFKLMISIYLF